MEDFSVFVQFISIPIFWIALNIIFDLKKFLFISYDSVKIVCLKKKIVSVEFWNSQSSLINIIINF